MKNDDNTIIFKWDTTQFTCQLETLKNQYLTHLEYAVLTHFIPFLSVVFVRSQNTIEADINVGMLLGANCINRALFLWIPKYYLPTPIP